MRLEGKIIEVNSITEEQKERMFELMSLYFDGIRWETFNRDLCEKDWIIVLQDYISGKIKGFSTQMILEHRLEGIPIKVVFSGDTIIHKDYWGETELMMIWGRFVLSLIKRYKGSKLYWLLISMGYKTYRFLPVFFNEFYPRYDKLTPEFEKKVMDTFGYLKYPDEYDNKSGIIHPFKTGVRLRPGVADINTHLLKNPHIEFFVRKNTLYFEGDELACVAELTEENLKPIAYKIINRDKPVALYSTVG